MRNNEAKTRSQAKIDALRMSIGDLEVNLKTVREIKTSKDDELMNLQGRLYVKDRNMENLKFYLEVVNAEIKINREQLERLRTSLETLNSSQSSFKSEIGTAFQRVQSDTASEIGFWATCRVVQALVEKKAVDDPLIDDLIYYPDGEMEGLLLRSIWSENLHQKTLNMATNERKPSLFNVFVACANQVPSEGYVFSSIIEDKEAAICVVLLPKDEVVMAVKKANSEIRLWQCYKSNCSITMKNWKQYVQLDQVPDLVNFVVDDKNDKEIVNWLRGVIEWGDYEGEFEYLGKRPRKYSEGNQGIRQIQRCENKEFILHLSRKP